MAESSPGGGFEIIHPPPGLAKGGPPVAPPVEREHVSPRPPRPRAVTAVAVLSAVLTLPAFVVGVTGLLAIVRLRLALGWLVYFLPFTILFLLMLLLVVSVAVICFALPLIAVTAWTGARWGWYLGIGHTFLVFLVTTVFVAVPDMALPGLAYAGLVLAAYMRPSARIYFGVGRPAPPQSSSPPP